MGAAGPGRRVDHAQSTQAPPRTCPNFGRAALGVGLQLQATKDRDEAERKLQSDCSVSCVPSNADGYGHSQLENRLAIGSLIVGGAALVTGTIMVVMNMPRTHRTKDEGDVNIRLVSF